jgi:hypothetical protein
VCFNGQIFDIDLSRNNLDYLAILQQAARTAEESKTKDVLLQEIHEK